MDHDLTVSEVLVDPLIAQLREADGLGKAAFAQLMQSAARVHTRKLVDSLQQQRADAFYDRIDVTLQKPKHKSF